MLNNFINGRRYMKTNAIRISEYGGPEVLEFREIDLPELQPGEASIRHTAIGLNFIDTYHRSGLYPMPLPTGLGSEAAGIVEEIANDVSSVKVGDRVVYTGCLLYTSPSPRDS